MAKRRHSAHHDTGDGGDHPSGLGLFGRLRAYFLAGFLLTAPISITLYIGWILVSFIDGEVQALIPERFNPETYLPFSVPGIGVIILVVALTVLGAFAAGVIGRMITGMSEAALSRIPAVRSIYGAVKQILETVLAKKSDAFREVVLIEYPRRGMWVLGFITGTTEGEVQNLTEDDLVNIFVPTTPNPTSGFLLFVPRSDCHVLDMTIEQGIKMVVSAGIVTPPDPRPPDERGEPEIPARTPDQIEWLDDGDRKVKQPRQVA